MKNLHILYTDKPSRLFYNVGGALLFTNYKHYNGVNIYITSSNEEIKEGEWYYDTTDFISLVPIYQRSQDLKFYNGCKKIILTTDQDLINDGVQAIDDDFLQWFVKNPSCEEVKVKEKQHFEADKLKRENPLNGVYYSYKIIIPKEEPKQETLEEAAENKYGLSDQYWKDRIGFVHGAKWQAERMLKFILDEDNHTEGELGNSCIDVQTLVYFIEQFKKK